MAEFAKLGKASSSGAGLQTSAATCKLIAMPELPDITAYISALEKRIVGQTAGASASRQSVSSAYRRAAAFECRRTHREELAPDRKAHCHRVEGDLWLVLHLMIAGRLHWKKRDAKIGGRQNSGRIRFSRRLAECSPKLAASAARRCTLSGAKRVWARSTPGASTSSNPILISFRSVLTAENHTLKRALTDPRLLSGIGNAYSDEILHAAQLSPVTLTSKLKPEEWERLFAATRATSEIFGWTASSPKRTRQISRKRSPRSVLRWPCTGAMGCPVRAAERRSCAFATPTRKPITVPAVRPEGRFWRTEACRACWGRTGRGRSRNWKP